MDTTNGRPPALAFADICAASTPTGTPTAAPATSTPASTNTPTGRPTGTATPFPTAVPLGSPPRIETFTADATQLAPGQVITLHWRVLDAAGVILVAGGQRVPVDAEGTTTLVPPGDVEVRMEATNNSGTASGSVQLQVIQPRVVTAVQAVPGPIMTPAPLPGPTVAGPASPAAGTPAGVTVSPLSVLPTAAVPQALRRCN